MADIVAKACTCIGEENVQGRKNSEVAQWMSLARTLKASDLAGLDASLVSKSHLVGHSLSLADAAVYVAVMTTKGIDVSSFPNITRFVVHIQKMVKAVPGVSQLPESTRPTFIPLAMKAAASSSSAAPKKEAAAGGADGGKKEKKEKKDAPAAAGAAAAANGASDEVNPSLLDFRVGEIVKCWNHPDSDKLLCEEVDLGEEGGPRNIASGIRAHYSAEEFVGKKVRSLYSLLLSLSLSLYTASSISTNHRCNRRRRRYPILSY
jgi:tRNA-binding EMAP/Myf-like protein